MASESGRQGARVGDRWESAIVVASLLYFAAKATFFAWTVPTGIFPDEVTHFGLVEVYSRFLLLPSDGPETYHLGLVTHVPPLYYFVLGKLLPFGGLVMLRLVNVLLACTTVWIGSRIARLLMSEPWARVAFIVMLTNTLMFTFLAGAVSYDNLTNLLAAVSLHQALLLVRERTLQRVFTLGIALALGTLTKLAFLPLAFLLVVALVAHDWRAVMRGLGNWRRALVPRTVGERLLAAICVLTTLASCHLYVGNLMRFGRLAPSAEQVVGLENAMENRVFARNHILAGFRAGEISIMEARSLALRIRHQGDKQATFALLARAMAEQGKPQRLDRLHHAAPWTDLMLARTYGILAHRTFEKRGLSMAPYYAIFLLAGIRLIRRAKRSDFGGLGLLLSIVVGGYLLILMQVVNYRDYAASGVLEMAVQGRYAFPILIPAYALAAHYLLDWRRPALRWFMAFVVAVSFVAGEFPWFLLEAPPAFSG